MPGLGEHLADDLLGPHLVSRVAVAEDERDTDRLDPVGDQLVRGLADLVLIQRDGYVAEHVNPLGRPLHPRAGYQRLVVAMGHQVKTVGVAVAQVGLDPAGCPTG